AHVRGARDALEPLRHLLVDHLGWIVEVDADHVAPVLLEQAVRPGRVIGTALDLLPRVGGVREQPRLARLFEQAALAEPRFADETDDLAAPLLDARHYLAQL